MVEDTLITVKESSKVMAQDIVSANPGSESLNSLKQQKTSPWKQLNPTLPGSWQYRIELNQFTASKKAFSRELHRLRQIQNSNLWAKINSMETLCPKQFWQKFGKNSQSSSSNGSGINLTSLFDHYRKLATAASNVREMTSESLLTDLSFLTLPTTGVLDDPITVVGTYHAISKVAGPRQAALFQYRRIFSKE